MNDVLSPVATRLAWISLGLCGVCKEPYGLHRVMAEHVESFPGDRLGIIKLETTCPQETMRENP